MAKSGQVVLITGCSTGIGRATAERLAGGGHTVYATARRTEAIADLEAKGCKTLALDVNDEASMRAAVEAVEAAEGSIDALVNNAGYSQSGAVESVRLDDVRGQFETNVFGLIRMSQLVLPGMRKQGSGRIVNIGSMGGKLTFPGGGIYHATKYAVEAISDALRWEVAAFGVKVVLIEPGLITSEFASAAGHALAEGNETGGPYDEFNSMVGKMTADVYKGPMKAFGGPPDAVAKVIQKVIEGRRPRPRYKVTISAKALMAQRVLTTDRMWDAMMAAQYKRPKAGG